MKLRIIYFFREINEPHAGEKRKHRKNIFLVTLLKEKKKKEKKNESRGAKHCELNEPTFSTRSLYRVNRHRGRVFEQSSVRETFNIDLKKHARTNCHAGATRCGPVSPVASVVASLRIVVSSCIAPAATSTVAAGGGGRVGRDRTQKHVLSLVSPLAFFFYRNLPSVCLSARPLTRSLYRDHNFEAITARFERRSGRALTQSESF